MVAASLAASEAGRSWSFLIPALLVCGDGAHDYDTWCPQQQETSVSGRALMQLGQTQFRMRPSPPSFPVLPQPQNSFWSEQYDQASPAAMVGSPWVGSQYPVSSASAPLQQSVAPAPASVAGAPSGEAWPVPAWAVGVPGAVPTTWVSQDEPMPLSLAHTDAPAAATQQQMQASIYASPPEFSYPPQSSQLPGAAPGAELSPVTAHQAPMQAWPPEFTLPPQSPQLPGAAPRVEGSPAATQQTPAQQPAAIPQEPTQGIQYMAFVPAIQLPAASGASQIPPFGLPLLGWARLPLNSSAMRAVAPLAGVASAGQGFPVGSASANSAKPQALQYPMPRSLLNFPSPDAAVSFDRDPMVSAMPAVPGSGPSSLLAVTAQPSLMRESMPAVQTPWVSMVGDPQPAATVHDQDDVVGTEGIVPAEQNGNNVPTSLTLQVSSNNGASSAQAVP